VGDRPRLIIITHTADRFLARATLAGHLIPRWRAMGLDVEVVTERDPFVPGDVALLHVDLSVIPDECRAIAQRYARVVNGAVLDIRKRRFSSHLVTGSDAGSGAVIVKTDRNHCGWPEFMMRFKRSLAARALSACAGERNALSWLARAEGLRPWRFRRLLPDYPVYPDAASIPHGVWNNSELVVERFQSERQGADYVCRHWLFFGDQEICRKTTAADPMVKLAGPPPRLHEPVPDALRQIRRGLGFDYGKFDYGVIDGEVILYDTNRTPGASRDPNAHAETLDLLANGIRAFVPALAEAQA
jgi:hypothetical protein